MKQQAFNNQSGMTILELLIVAIVIAVVAMSIGAFMVQQLKSQQQSEFRRQSEDIANRALKAASQQSAIINTEEQQFNSVGPTATPSGYWDSCNQYDCE